MAAERSPPPSPPSPLPPRTLHVRALIALRRNEPALLAQAGFTPLYAQKDRYPFVFLRRLGQNQILVALNPANAPAKISFKAPIASTAPALLAGQNGHLMVSGTEASLEMEATTFSIYRLSQ